MVAIAARYFVAGVALVSGLVAIAAFLLGLVDVAGADVPWGEIRDVFPNLISAITTGTEAVDRLNNTLSQLDVDAINAAARRCAVGEC
jgi:hypothetical protein